ncbi:hypothetical protein M0R45_002537 [Rubus argutus]|uniref:Uncharacterized protein n=1 Tax=Rubus argutus TaxID=59490 RepID=A0AAW1VS40_RUBAR
MGNCCLRRDSAAVWASEDDWVSVSQLHQNSQQPEKQKLLGEDQGGAGDVDQLLAGVINDRDEQVEEHHRPWRPALQTIPELN